MMRRYLAILALAFSGCLAPPPYVPGPPPPAPPAPTPTPTPPDESVARAKWDAVAVGMTEAEVTALLGSSKHRAIVGNGVLSLGYYVKLDDGRTHYVEAVFDAKSSGKVKSKTVW